MAAAIPIPEMNFSGIMPALVLSVAGFVVLTLGLFIKKGVNSASMVVSLIGVAVAAAFNTRDFFPGTLGFSALVAYDQYSWFLNLIILFAAGLTVLTSVRYLGDEKLDAYEYYVLLLFAAAGMMFMVASNHLLLIFVGLETLSVCLYIVSGILPNSLKSKEAALKYLILGAFSSATFLYGTALLFGATGSADLVKIFQALKAGTGGMTAMIGMGLVLVGFGFKTAAVPFHMWTPDVYDGAPTPWTGFMSVGVKAAAFATFARVFFEALPGMQQYWAQILWVVAALTMILGNFAALAQQNIKRMLAYSSIAHAGYILVGLLPGQGGSPQEGAAAMLYYLLAYTFTNIGAFGIVAIVGSKGEANINLNDYRGLAGTHPLLAFTMTIFLLSLTGIPPTAGFVGKFSVFRAAIDAGYIWLVVIGVLTSAVSVFYYFRVIMKMYMENEEAAPTLRFEPAMTFALTISAVVILYIGVFPTRYLNLARESVTSLFQ